MQLVSRAAYKIMGILDIVLDELKDRPINVPSALCPICKIRECYKKRSMIKVGVAKQNAKGNYYFKKTGSREKVDEWWTCKKCTEMPTKEYIAFMIEHFNNAASSQSPYREEARRRRSSEAKRSNITIYKHSDEKDIFPIILEAARLRTVHPDRWVKQKRKKCPKCNSGTLVERDGRYGSFYGCSNYPKCKHTEKIIN